jgi:hypothetical protein
VPVLLVNDAELAAASASASGPRGTRALALTLGFGPGAAWTAPEPRRVR